MVDINPPQDPFDLAEELNPNTKIAQFKDLEIHLFSAPQAPRVMKEIGRIREQEFRLVGAGRNLPLDIDSRDTQWPWYTQLVSWDPQEMELVAMYRFIPCGWAIEQGGVETLRTSELFDFSKKFRTTILEHSVELGRSVVNRRAKRAIQGLFSVWTGLGALIREWPEIRYFFGNVSLYQTIPQRGLNILLSFLQNHHGQEPGLVIPRNPLPPEWIGGNESPPSFSGDWDRDYDFLLEAAREQQWSVPPILISYLKAHRGLGYFATSGDSDFGNAWEAAITVPTQGLDEKMEKRFLSPYESVNPRCFQKTFWETIPRNFQP